MNDSGPQINQKSPESEIIGMKSIKDQIVGIDQRAYEQRQEGISPENIRDVLWSLIGSEVQGSILDAGSGRGGWIRRLATSQKITSIHSVDIVDDGASKLPGVKFSLVDLSKDALPLKDNELDWVFAVEVLEHLANPRHFINEASRVLKNGGKLVISTPSNDSLRAKISFMLRGYFPAFCDHDYHGSGHITPVFMHDLKRISKEAHFKKVVFDHSVPGRLPKFSLEWQTIFPFLRGKQWSDVLIAIFTK